MFQELNQFMSTPIGMFTPLCWAMLLGSMLLLCGVLGFICVKEQRGMRASSGFEPL